ncbi:MAG: TolC family protein [Armatimonadota bacterium]
MDRYCRMAISLLTVSILATGVQAQTPAPEPVMLKNLIPKVCPANPGNQVTSGSRQITSPPMTVKLPEMKSSTSKPGDTVQTPADSSSNAAFTTRVPSLVGAAIPEDIKSPISLDKAIQIAFQYSPDIQSSIAQVEASRGVIDAAKASFNPVFKLQASSALQGPESTAVKTSTTQAGLTATLPLDVSHQMKYNSEITQMQFQLQYLQMVSASEQLILKVKTAYYALLRSCGQETVRQAAVDDAKLRLSNIHAKRSEGTVPQFDVTTAEVELDNLNQQLISAQSQVKLAQAGLNAAMGVDVNYPTQVVSSDVLVGIREVDIPNVTEQAYAKRPDVKSAQVSVALSNKSITLQKTGLSPTASITGASSYNFNPSAMSTDNYSWQAAVTLSIPLSDGGATKARVRQAQANAQSSMSSLDRTLLNVSNELRTIALNLQDAALRTQTTEHAVALAIDALDIAKERYGAGIAVQVEVSNAQSQLTQARFNYVNALFDYALSYAQLEKATSSQPEMNNLQLLADQSHNTSHDKEPQK